MKNQKFSSESETVDICAPYQREFYNCEDFRHEKKLIRKLTRKKKKEGFFTYPLPAVIRSESDVEISENADFTDSEKISTENGEAKIYNLKKNTKYYWRTDSDKSGSFITDDVMPRWIYAEGYCNIRDFGGETVKDGRKIRQGMIYRGPRLEKSPLPEGIEALKKLNIKTDLDLRKEAIGKLTASPLGEKCNFILHPCECYEEFLADNKKNIKYLIEYFADERLYPIYFHCHGGQDRTGTLAFMLGAILGLSDETLIREYELTMLSSPERKISRSRKHKIKKFLEILTEKDENKSLCENTVDFLRECRVTESTMDKIRKIML